LSEPTKSEGLNYSVLGLSQNPFPKMGIPDRGNLLTIDRGLSRFVEFMEVSIDAGESFCGAIIGPYGFGKTHSLFEIERIFRNREDVLTVYVPTPGFSFLTIYREVVRRLGPDLLGRLGAYVDGYLREALMKLNGDGAQAAYYWIIGERLPYSDRLKLGLGPNINDRTAAGFLHEIISALSRSGTKAVILLLDELESIIDLPTLNRRRYLNLMRRLVDENPAGLALVVASTPVGWDNLMTSNPALFRRLSSRTMYLDGLSKAEAEELLRRYCDRIGAELPFEAETIEFLMKVGGNNPGELLKMASLLVDEAALAGRGSIDPSFAESVLATYL